MCDKLLKCCYKYWLVNGVQPVSIMFSLPEVDRFSIPDNCTVKRKLKLPSGSNVAVNIYRPEIFTIFEKGMGGVDQLCVVFNA